MQTRRLGPVEVSAIGLGAMPLSIDGRPAEDRAFATVHAALDAGVTLIDTADAYALGLEDFGHGEAIVARALAAYGGDTSHVVVATKGGHTREADGSWTLDGRPEYLREAARASLSRLGGDAVDLWQFHRPDPEVPWEESMGAIRELLDDGIIRMAGISNADPAQIETAIEIVGDGLVAVQNEFSPRFRSSEPELELCGERGLAFLPWSPLGGMSRADDLAGPFAAVGEEVGATPQQVCLAWELAKSPHVIPIPGSSRPETVDVPREACARPGAVVRSATVASRRVHRDALSTQPRGVDRLTARRHVAAAIGASAILAGVPAAAHADEPRPKSKQSYPKAYKEAKRAGAEPGRNIVEEDVRDRRARTREAREGEVRRSLAVLRRMVAPAPAPARVATTGGSTASSGLEAIAACESGGDPSAVSADGTYRGTYQLDRQTWESVGGTGDPAAAPEAEQGARAQALMAQRGSSPWPVCG